MRRIVFLIFPLFLIACDKSKDENDPIQQLPTIKTTAVSEITSNSAKSGGEDISSGSTEIIEKGLCWNTSENPTINDHKKIEGVNSLDFVSQLTDLDPNTTYFVRAYATNDEGTGYGNQVMFTTLEETQFGEVSDMDGNVYKTVEIGDQVWMAENLRVTQFNDGTEIPIVNEEENWGDNTNPMLSFQFDNPTLDSLYGAYYSLSVVNEDLNGGKNVCPSGWHVPTELDWNDLVEGLGGEMEAGGKLKATGTDYWWSPNIGATNETGFNALPGGDRNPSGFYVWNGILAFFWTQSTTEFNSNLYQVSYSVENDHPGVERNLFSINHQVYGLNIRCIKD